MAEKFSLPNLEDMRIQLLEAQKDRKVHKFVPISNLNDSKIEELFNITFPHFQEKINELKLQEKRNKLQEKRDKLLELQEKEEDKDLKFIPITDLSDSEIEELFTEMVSNKPLQIAIAKKMKADFDYIFDI